MLRFDDKKLSEVYTEMFPAPPQRPSAITGAGKLVRTFGDDPDITDLRWAAYMLATVKHECANTWAPIVERGAREYFDKYEAGTPIGARLGNTQPGDGYQYRGRGFVQITGRNNYKKLGQLLNLGDRLVKQPELALDFDIAYKIMSYGMRHGTFTGRKLESFIHSTECDYLHARRIINGLDRAESIQGYAKKLEIVLRESLVS